MEDSADRLQAAKQAIRERVWRALEGSGAARFPGAWGRIPHFVGAEAAAERLSATPEWRAAHVLKVNPDRPQLPVRARALAEGKVVYMAVPRLAAARPFMRLDPRTLRALPAEAASIRGALRFGEPVGLGEVPRIDLIVCGSVAVNRQGVRIGKGGGYSDLELALLLEFGLVDDRTCIATTVHPLQLLDEPLPETEHDFRVDLIATPERILYVGSPRRPPGVLWDHLRPRMLDRIPVLAELKNTPGGAP